MFEIEKLFTQPKDEAKRKALEEGFKRAAKDPEMYMLAEAGLDDYFERLQKWEESN